MPCIFCSIASGNSGTKVYETKKHVVCMDIQPLSRGHMLVIPKYHAERLENLPDEYLSESLVLIKRIVKTAGTISDYNILQNNGHMQSVGHVHFHLVPFHSEEAEGLSVNWNPCSASAQEIALIQDSYVQLFKNGLME